MISNVNIQQYPKLETSTTNTTSVTAARNLISMNCLRAATNSLQNNLNNNNLVTKKYEMNEKPKNNLSTSCDDYISAATYDKFIENMHNYSQPSFKYNNMIEKNNNNHHNHNNLHHDNNEHSENEEDDEKVKTLDGDDKTPDHHARRPMNAFLIFCKRHRSIVREKYPNLENRSITKILGDWWANLDKEEKSCYTILAKQYKDAFFTANPNFKWYKLPAPPLRTHHPIRPSNLERSFTNDFINDDYENEHIEIVKQEQEIDINDHYDDDEVMENDDDGDDDVKQNENNDIDDKKIKTLNFEMKKTEHKNSVGVFKFADETQMGGLSSLMQSHHTNNNNNNNNTNNNNNNIMGENESKNEKVHKTNALYQTKQSIKTEPFTNMRDHAEKMQKNSLNNKMGLNYSSSSSNSNSNSSSSSNISNTNKRKCDISETETLLCKKLPKLSQNDLNNSIESDEMMNNNCFYDDGTLKKSSRACKGKRYLEFMNTGKLQSSVNKKSTKYKNITSTNFPHNGYCIKTEIDQHSSINDHQYHVDIKKKDFDKNYGNDGNYYEKNNTTITSGLSAINSNDGNGKLFDASDFDLEEKIKALPSLSLDKYLARKRETKKKKKLNKPKSGPKIMNAILEAREKIQNSIVGSQKRKARKESITRRDILPINDNNNANSLESKEFGSNTKTSTNTIVKPIVPDIIQSHISPTNEHNTTAPTSDLLILATLAEEEAKKNNVTDV